MIKQLKRQKRKYTPRYYVLNKDTNVLEIGAKVTCPHCNGFGGTWVHNRTSYRNCHICGTDGFVIKSLLTFWIRRFKRSNQTSQLFTPC